MNEQYALSHRGDPVTSYEAGDQFGRSGKQTYLEPTDALDDACKSDQTAATALAMLKTRKRVQVLAPFRVYTSEPTDTVEVTRGGTTYRQESQEKGIGRDERRRSRYGERWVNG